MPGETRRRSSPGDIARVREPPRSVAPTRQHLRRALGARDIDLATIAAVGSAERQHRSGRDACRQLARLGARHALRASRTAQLPGATAPPAAASSIASGACRPGASAIPSATPIASAMLAANAVGATNERRSRGCRAASGTTLSVLLRREQIEQLAAAAARPRRRRRRRAPRCWRARALRTALAARARAPADARAAPHRRAKARRRAAPTITRRR